MKIQQAELAGALVIDPQVFEDRRGFFLEVYQQERYAQLGVAAHFVQDNHSRSSYGTLRGLHYQLRHPQGKLVWAIRGEVYDVAVDLRCNSPTFGRWMGIQLSESNHRQVYLPPGMAHGFCVLSEMADVMYKCTEPYHPGDEYTLRWDDPQLGIPWPIPNPTLSDKDRRGLYFPEAPHYEFIE